MNKTFVNASLTRIFFARLFDLIITSIFIGLNLFFIKINSYITALEFVLASFCVYVFFLLFIPLLFKSRTLGKMLFKIYLLYNESLKHVSFWVVFKRELYFIIIPYIIEMIFEFVRAYISVQYGEKYNSYGLLFENIGQLIYVLWFIYVSLTILMQENKLSIVDIKNNCAVYKSELLEEKFQKPPKPKKEVPGLIDKEELDKIINIDYKDVVDKNEK